MKLVTMILTVMTLAACHVEGPEAEVKSTPERAEKKKSNRQGLMFWGQAQEDGHPDQLFVLGVDLDNKKLSIRAIDWDEGEGEYVPLSGPKDCIDHYTEVETSDVVSMSGHSFHGKQKGDKSLNITVQRGNPVGVVYEIKDPDGNTVTYTISKRKIPHTPTSAVYRRLLLNGDDCDHVSKSDNDNGN